MAVTQQLARLTSDQLTQCRRSVEYVNRLCSFQLLPPGDYLDLDWAPAPLLQAVEQLTLYSPVVATLRRALSGDAEINPNYRDVPYTVFDTQ
jgi:hypothetical protein